jgi:nucleoid-associated protein YgaU
MAVDRRLSGVVWRSAWRRGFCLALIGLLAAGGCGPDPKATTQPAPRIADRVAATEGRSSASDPQVTDDRSDINALPGRIHIVQPGETLYSITAKYYGDGRQWRRILVANRNRLADPKDLRTGMKLIIP